MLSRYTLLLKGFALGADLFSLGFSLWISWYYFGDLNAQGLYSNSFSHVIIAFLTWLMVGFISQLYTAGPIFAELMKKTFKALTLYVLLIFAYLFAIKHLQTSRLFLFTFIGVFSFLVICTRMFILIALKPLIKYDHSRKRVAIVGNSEMSYRAAYYFSNSKSGYEFVGFFDDESNYRQGYPVLGNVESCLEFAKSNKVDEIYSTVLPESNEALKELVSEAERNFIRFKFIPDFNYLFHRHVNLSLEGGIPVISFREEPLENIVNRINKRVFDLLFTFFVFMIILWWLIPLIALIIKIDSKGPVFFIQRRSGRNNKIFDFYKFRSMRVNDDADHRHASKNDDRITKVGKFLRKTSLDELPQFLNVIKGDISVVGPRPHMLKHTDEYSRIINKFMVRHFLKPGITGWAQINGFRGDVNPELMEKRVELDIWYMENWSFWLDIKIILKTAWQVIKPSGSAW
jgi:putative colanic acid biosysnthesis UDP-glucose lipid carrier transferase